MKKFEINYLIKNNKQGIKDNEGAKYKADDVKSSDSSNACSMMDNNNIFEKVKK